MPTFPSNSDLDRAADILRRGGLVAIPTETVYGLAANALDEQAVCRIFEAKGRPLTSPLIVHVAEVATARQLTAVWPPLADDLAGHFWPGPLTIILPKAAHISGLVTAGLPSVGLRVPAHPVALEVLRRTGIPLAAPSANRFMQISPTTAEHVRQSLGDAVDFILDGGPASVGIESTVVSLAGPAPVILRPGMISAADLKGATGISWAETSPQRNSEMPQESPGLHARHYAPRTPLLLLKPGDPQPFGRGQILGMPNEATAFAEALYSRLHVADEAHWDWIGILEPPDTPEWAGIRDRLKRASTKL
jgi:L-threonylcarbamoyladenylate synthase